jgi:hypothetical protein
VKSINLTSAAETFWAANVATAEPNATSAGAHTA